MARWASANLEISHRLMGSIQFQRQKLTVLGRPVRRLPFAIRWTNQRFGVEAQMAYMGRQPDCGWFAVSVTTSSSAVGANFVRGATPAIAKSCSKAYMRRHTHCNLSVFSCGVLKHGNILLVPRSGWGSGSGRTIRQGDASNAVTGMRFHF